MPDISDHHYDQQRGAAATAGGGLWAWINKRFPAESFIRSQALEYYAPKNFNFWYYFGSLALVVLVMQLLDIPPIPNAISIYPLNKVPSTPVPVAG